MQNEEFVSARLFRESLAAQLSQQQQLLAMVSALAQILRLRGIVTPELWSRYFDEAQQMGEAVAVRKTIERLRGSESIEDILKDYEGPIQ